MTRRPIAYWGQVIFIQIITGLMDLFPSNYKVENGNCYEYFFQEEKS
jgi:hypothetical protein